MLVSGYLRTGYKRVGNIVGRMLTRDREAEARDGGALIEVQAVSFCLSNPPAQISSRSQRWILPELQRTAIFPGYKGIPKQWLGYAVALACLRPYIRPHPPESYDYDQLDSTVLPGEKPISSPSSQNQPGPSDRCSPTKARNRRLRPSPQNSSAIYSVSPRFRSLPARKRRRKCWRRSSPRSIL